MSAKKKNFLERRIEQFCDSSAELLSGIHAKYNGAKKDKSKSKKKNYDVNIIQDIRLEVNDDEPIEGLM